MSIEGVDYAWPPHPSPSSLKAAGKHFVVRYGGPGSDEKQLHADEVQALKAAGIDIVANAEGAANGFTGTAAGKSWAKSADNHFQALGMPADRPIYFSADFDTSSNDWSGIDAALRGAASVIGSARVGVYGEYELMQHCRANGTARWFWQTYAWSDGRQPSSFVHLYQYKNGQKIGGASCDFVRALLPDYGQWGWSNDMAVSLNQDDIDAVAKAVWGYKLQDPYDANNPDRNLPAGTWQKYSTSRGQVSNVLAAVQALGGELDPEAFAAAVVAKLPAVGDPVSQDEVTAAVKEAFREAFSSSPTS